MSGKNTVVTGNNPIAAIEGVADAAVAHYGPWILERGGPAGRARSLRAMGHGLEGAITIAAKQGKGHVAEIRLAAEQTLQAGATEKPYASRPNPVANDPHVDIEVLEGLNRVSDAQVGVGGQRYLMNKARSSEATQVVINTEARKGACEVNPEICARTTDTLTHGGTASRPLSGVRAEGDAKSALKKLILEEDSVPFSARLGLAGSQAVEAFVPSFGVQLLYETVHCIHTGLPFDREMITRSLINAVQATARTGIQTYLSVDRFLEKAGAVYQMRLLREVGRSAVWAGAVADVVVATAQEVVAWVRGQMELDELLRRFGVHAFTAGGAGLAVSAVLPMCGGLPWWTTAIICLVVANLGASFGRQVGGKLLLPSPLPE